MAKQPQLQPPDPGLVLGAVRAALNEDLGDGDRSAGAVAPGKRCTAQLLTREDAVLCGTPWFEAAFRELDAGTSFTWTAAEGDAVRAGQALCKLDGKVRALLGAERTALNFLQLLSGVATVTRRYAEVLHGSDCRVLDTRKTIPGLRLAQKYAVRVGGGHNHRSGLYDGVLLKENHLHAAGGIGAALAAINRAQPPLPPEMPLAVEVETLDELDQALDAGAQRILLDNFGLDDLREAVRRTRRRTGRAALEASGGVTRDKLRKTAATGVDFISVGDLTKNVRAIDYSLLFELG